MKLRWLNGNKPSSRTVLVATFVVIPYVLLFVGLLQYFTLRDLLDSIIADRQITEARSMEEHAMLLDDVQALLDRPETIRVIPGKKGKETVIVRTVIECRQPNGKPCAKSTPKPKPKPSPNPPPAPTPTPPGLPHLPIPPPPFGFIGALLSFIRPGP